MEDLAPWCITPRFLFFPFPLSPLFSSPPSSSHLLLPSSSSSLLLLLSPFLSVFLSLPLSVCLSLPLSSLCHTGHWIQSLHIQLHLQPFLIFFSFFLKQSFSKSLKFLKSGFEFVIFLPQSPRPLGYRSACPVMGPGLINLSYLNDLWLEAG